ncbi:ABC transporter permease [Peptostreptococcus stomatis]|uniref:ABC transporter permease n=1 Tax=Peptostreptococcus stomatis TaxID=341694 RepID=UPI0028D2E811|nr:ABC transporter permease [Peptostreptococcus stomatis]
MIKNAIAYVSRKKNRTVIVFIILTLVLSCLYSCLSIMKSSDSLEKTLYKSSNSSLSITKKANGYFEIDQFKNIEKIKEVGEVVPQYNGMAKPTNTKVVEGQQKIEREDLPSEFKNVVSVEGTSNTKRNVLFTSGVFTIKEGRNIEKNDRGKVLVHEDFAKKNNLKLKDKIGLELFEINNKGSNKEYKFEIVGIFSGKKQEKYTGLSSDFSENTMFVDYESSQKALNRGVNKKVANKLALFSASAEETNVALKKIKESKVDWSKYAIEKDSNAFEESLESLSGIKHIIKIMTFSIMIGGVIVLSLILILWLRERIYEIGILLSIGVSKVKIVGQFMLELILISLPAIVASLFIGNLLLSQMVGGFMDPDSSTTLTNNLLENSSVLDNIVTFIQSYGILIGIIVISVVIACAMILIKKPKEILSKIS